MSHSNHHWVGLITSSFFKLKQPLILRIKLYLQVFFTTIVWGVLITLAGWVIASLGWYLLYLIWKRELLIPSATSETAIALMLTLIWALVVLLGLFIWSKYNYRFYYLHNKRKVSLLEDTTPSLEWSEKMIDTAKVDYAAMVGNATSQQIAKGD